MMFQDLFIPIPFSFQEKEYVEDTLGRSVSKHETNKFPDLLGVDVAFFDIVDVLEGGYAKRKDFVREEFYPLYKGNWDVKLIDLGSLVVGENKENVFSTVENIMTYLIKQNIIPVILASTIDFVFPLYKGYGGLDKMMNLSVVTPQFGLGNTEEKVSDKNYLSKIILEESCNMFNYSNIGYQTYFNSQKEIQLVETLDFEAYRLGDFDNISNVEPVIRDADAFAIDLSSVKYSDFPINDNPNGFTGVQLCAMARYAGMSDKLSSLGLFNYNVKSDKNSTSSKLISQIMWYFVEGYALRVNDYPLGSKENYLKYIVPLGDDNVVFYQSNKSLRWWIKAGYGNEGDVEAYLLIPCTYQDYINATEQKLTERWFKLFRKLN